MGMAVLTALVVITNVVYREQSSRFLETSMLHILQNIVEKSTEPPDLMIEEVTLRKVSEPSESFKYYTYDATVIVKNLGGDLRNAQVTLSAGPDQKSIFVKNNGTSFSLYKDETFIVRGYEILIDSSYNGADVTLEINIADDSDYYPGNDTYTVNIFQLPAKIENIGVSEILEDGTMLLDFEAYPFRMRDHDFEIYFSDSAYVDEENLKYAEVFGLEQIYSYHRFENSLQNVKSDFTAESVEFEDLSRIKFSDNPFNYEEDLYVYLKATNPHNGNFAISNVLKFSAQQDMSRAEFAKLFVENTDLEIDNVGVNFYDDVIVDEWYSPYVQTLFNYGLLNNRTYTYSPNHKMSREEVLEVVMDYYDVDLAIPPDAPNFADVSLDSDFLPYAEGFFASGKASAIRENFYPEQMASRSFLNYLINEYQENN